MPNKGKLYTTYLSKAKKIPEAAVKIIIMREPPFNVLKYPQFVWMPDLAPSTELLWDYKSGEITWHDFTDRYMDEIKANNINVTSCEDSILSNLQEGRDVYLICCEKDSEHCHRTVYAKYFKNSYNVEWEEMK